MLASEVWPVRLLRLLFGGLAVLAVGAQFGREVVLPGFSPVNFFSYFTILSNSAAGLFLIGLALAPGRNRARLAEWLRGAMTVYLATTGIVYAVLLDTGELGLTLPWVNAVLHRVIPIVLFVDWLAVCPQCRVDYGKALAWIGVPMLYLVYSLTRGVVVDWYPYPFLQPVEVGGPAGVLLHILGIAVGIAAVSLLVAWAGNVRVRASQMRAAA
ncbi:Pr6Pr family membrane protein [Haloactinomyces albus]|uniref:FAR-17a/AIG1-like protein n=1 Tax=Haloactinomyces albus TaxID=1352928 RepID=A0AAE4CN11_9ACTN|nr:Pr6Pr family membrane protein [Haloactinomyces albus]MDR7302966.1 hypothetical protein [Haloactinomyces albus]